MQVAATYEDGTINFAQPLRFARRKFQVMVSIPEDELEPNAQHSSSLDALLAQTPGDPWLQRMKTIELHTLAVPAAQLPEITAKQLERIEAFALREDR